MQREGIMHNHHPQPISEDWMPSQDDRHFAKSIGMTANQLDEDARRFRAYYQSKQYAKMDWSRTFRSWLRQTMEYGGWRPG
jgi:hypothetical protein